MSEARVLSIDQLLGRELQIPPYQRPYKWMKKNITDLPVCPSCIVHLAQGYALDNAVVGMFVR